jgi:hypothetical protein
MTNSDLAHTRQQYTRRNAFAAAVQSLVFSFAKHNQQQYLRSGRGGAFETPRVETGDWMSGFHMVCEGLDRSAEVNILTEVKALFPRLRIEVVRKTINHPRFISFSF